MAKNPRAENNPANPEQMDKVIPANYNNLLPLEYISLFRFSYVLLNNRLSAIHLTNQVLSTVVNSDPAYYYNQCHQLHLKPVSSGPDWQIKRLYQLTYHLTLLTVGIEKSKLQEPAAPDKEELAIMLLHLQGFNYKEISQITTCSVSEVGLSIFKTRQYFSNHPDAFPEELL